MFVRAMGKSTLGLSVGLNVAETLLAPAMPSTSARAGGIFMPIIKSLSQSAGSNPGALQHGALAPPSALCLGPTGIVFHLQVDGNTTVDERSSSISDS